MNNVIIIGASGAIGRAFGNAITARVPDAKLHCFSRKEGQLDLLDEDRIASCITRAQSTGPIDLAIIATGILHQDHIQPEKSLAALSAEAMRHILAVNTIGPSLSLKHLLPAMNRNAPSRIGVLSARVGSISDNQLGGWYSYRASKAALNMVIKSAAIEATRRNRQSVIVGLHPGTVDSALSAPFQKGVPPSKLFSPEHSTAAMLNVLMAATPDLSGRCFDYAGKEVQP